MRRQDRDEDVLPVHGVQHSAECVHTRRQLQRQNGRKVETMTTHRTHTHMSVWSCHAGWVVISRQHNDGLHVVTPVHLSV